MRVDAVIVAAGGSTRFGPQDKLLADLCGLPVIARTVRPFLESERIGAIVIVTSRDNMEAIGAAAGGGDRVLVVEGGARRRDSVAAGLRAARTRSVAIQDGARPLVTRALVESVIDGAEGRPGAIAAVPVSDTIKEVVDGTIRGHPDRSRLWAAQTPQVVLRQAWLDAAGMSDGDETDDAAMLSRLGLECAVVEGDAGNIKITRPLDLLIAAAILRERGLA